MKAYKRRVLGIALLMLGSAACAVEVEDSPGPTNAGDVENAGDMETEEVALHAAMRAAGFDPERAVFRGEIINVDDIVLFRTPLLAGEYGVVGDDEGAAPDALIDKGYSNRNERISSAYRGNIRFRVNQSQTPDGPLPVDLAYSASLAAKAWSEATSFRLSITKNHTGPLIDIYAISASSWPAGTTCLASQIACAAFPYKGKPGPYLYIRDSTNPYRNAGVCEWTESALTALLRHEMGHAIGMRHPGDWHPDDLIPGTAQCATPNAGCISSPGYATIMNASIFSFIGRYPGCEMKPGEGRTSLSADDKLSAATIYP